VPRVLERRQTAGIGPRGRLVLESGRRSSQGIMRPDLVELLAPAGVSPRTKRRYSPTSIRRRYRQTGTPFLKRFRVGGRPP
jgi:hypothetical protein